MTKEGKERYRFCRFFEKKNLEIDILLNYLFIGIASDEDDMKMLIRLANDFDKI